MKRITNTKIVKQLVESFDFNKIKQKAGNNITNNINDLNEITLDLMIKKLNELYGKYYITEHDKKDIKYIKKFTNVQKGEPEWGIIVNNNKNILDLICSDEFKYNEFPVKILECTQNLSIGFHHKNKTITQEIIDKCFPKIIRGNIVHIDQCYGSDYARFDSNFNSGQHYGTLETLNFLPNHIKELTICGLQKLDFSLNDLPEDLEILKIGNIYYYSIHGSYTNKKQLKLVELDSISVNQIQWLKDMNIKTLILTHIKDLTMEFLTQLKDNVEDLIVMECDKITNDEIKIINSWNKTISIPLEYTFDEIFQLCFNNLMNIDSDKFKEIIDKNVECDEIFKDDQFIRCSFYINEVMDDDKLPSGIDEIYVYLDATYEVEGNYYYSSGSYYDPPEYGEPEICIDDFSVAEITVEHVFNINGKNVYIFRSYTVDVSEDLYEVRYKQTKHGKVKQPITGTDIAKRQTSLITDDKNKEIFKYLISQCETEAWKGNDITDFVDERDDEPDWDRDRD